jgi:DNA primase
MAFPPQFLDELRARASLVGVVARRVKLTKKGREFQGLCPFHNEKSPSFTVNEEKGFFHCFGCGAHGDAIGFEMRAHHLSFTEAVERLASECGLEVPKATPEERRVEARRASLHDAMEAACQFFEKQLRGPAGREGLAYLRGRGLSDDTIARFRLGWSPDCGRNICWIMPLLSAKHWHCSKASRLCLWKHTVARQLCIWR